MTNENDEMSFYIYNLLFTLGALLSFQDKNIQFLLHRAQEKCLQSSHICYEFFNG